MFDYNAFYNLVRIIDENWAAKESVDWSEAEQIIKRCKSIPKDEIEQFNLSDITEIVTYSERHDEWDSGEVCNWPTRLMACIDKITVAPL